MPKELNALKTQLDDVNKKLFEANININNSNNKIYLSNTKTKKKIKTKKKAIKLSMTECSPKNIIIYYPN